MNRDIFLQVRDAIEAEPFRYYQRQYRRTFPQGSCGTAFCIAGWMVELDENFDHDMDSKTHAIRIQSGVPFHYIAAGVMIGDLSIDDADVLFAEGWRPKPGLELYDALTMLAQGYSVEDITGSHTYKALLVDPTYEEE